MVYTVTFNPSLDYVVNLDNFIQGKVNRTKSEKINVGGKGINVSIVLNNLGVENTALGFVAGFTGNQIEESVRKLGGNAKFIHVKEGFSRINVKIKTDIESEINGTGPMITPSEIMDLYEILDEIKEDEVLVLAGSIPKSLPDTIYMNILDRLKGKNIKFVVDATGKLLVNVLKYNPFLIKPNNHELEEIFDTVVDSEEKIIHYGKELIKMGAQNVLVSRGKDGAILFTDNGNIIKCKAPSGKVIDSVGAGDSMVAGFLAGYLEKADYEFALKMGICTGSASAFSEKLATKEEVEKLMEESL